MVPICRRRVPKMTCRYLGVLRLNALYIQREKPMTLDIRKKLAHIDAMLAAHGRDPRPQDIGYAPWIVVFAGMTFGAALFAVGMALGGGIICLPH